MAIRSILVPLTGRGDLAGPMQMALGLGKRFGATVEVRYVAPDPRLTLPYMGEGISPGLVESLMEAMEKEDAARRAAARTAAEQACKSVGVVIATGAASSGFSVTFADLRGDAAGTIGRVGRLSDLIVLARPAEEAPEEDDIAQAAVMESGRPVLLVPPGGASLPDRRVLVAWNGSREAARALSTALPFMQGGEFAEVVTVGELSEDQPTAAEAAISLVRHEVKAEGKVLPDTGDKVSEVLLREAHAMRCDLVVMGAYTHSRVRELVLGGVTRYVLSDAGIPVLLIH
ncbi:MAG: universal stress protein [Alphaproteobacteria bacterium]|nr:universal stress protein [Alphaproteobacteria bacterium]